MTFVVVVAGAVVTLAAAVVGHLQCYAEIVR